MLPLGVTFGHNEIAPPLDPLPANQIVGNSSINHSWLVIAFQSTVEIYLDLSSGP